MAQGVISGYKYDKATLFSEPKNGKGFEMPRISFPVHPAAGHTHSVTFLALSAVCIVDFGCFEVPSIEEKEKKEREFFSQ